MKKITIEELKTYFNTRAPKALREKGILTCTEYVWKEEGEEGDRNLYIVNDCYVVRYIKPVSMNPLMRNQHFTPVIKGIKLSRLDTIKLRDSFSFLKIDCRCTNVNI